MIISTQSTAYISTLVFLVISGLEFINVLKTLEDFSEQANYSAQSLLNFLKIEIMSLNFDLKE